MVGLSGICLTRSEPGWNHGKYVYRPGSTEMYCRDFLCKDIMQNICIIYANLNTKGEESVRKLKEFWVTLPEVVAVTKREGVMIVTISALIGVILGMLCSPRRNTRYGCDNGNTVNHNWNDDILLEEEDEILE